LSVVAVISLLTVPTIGARWIEAHHFSAMGTGTDQQQIALQTTQDQPGRRFSTDMAP
jgi:hypothetical protein